MENTQIPAIQDRIAYLIESLGTNMNAFAKRLDVSNTLIMNICKRRRSKPSFDVLEKILNEFPDLNARWLMTGKGAMYENSESESTDTKTKREQELEIQVNKLIDTVHHLSKGDYPIQNVN